MADKHGPSLGETVIQDQRKEVMEAVFNIMDEKWLKRLIELKPFVWGATMLVPHIVPRVPLLNLLPAYVMNNLAPQFYDELKNRIKSGAGSTKTDGKGKETPKTTIREAIGTLNKPQFASAFLERLKTLSDAKREEFLSFQVNPGTVKSWIVFLSIIKPEEFENGIELLMKTKPASTPAMEKVIVLVELTKGLYPVLDTRLRKMEVGKRSKVVGRIETMVANEALAYMVRLDAMETADFDEHVKMLEEENSLHRLTDKVKIVGKAVVDFHEKQQPGNLDTLFGWIKREFTRGREAAR